MKSGCVSDSTRAVGRRLAEAYQTALANFGGQARQPSPRGVHPKTETEKIGKIGTRVPVPLFPAGCREVFEGFAGVSGRAFPSDPQPGGATTPGRSASRLDLTQLSSYAVEVRYDFEFWPDRQTAQEAIGLASEVRRLVLGAVPAGAHP